MEIALLILKFAPLIFSLIQSVEATAQTVAVKPTGAQKLAAVTSALAVVAKPLADAAAANPGHSAHLNDYISGTVAVIDSLNAWGGQQQAAASA